MLRRKVDWHARPIVHCRWVRASILGWRGGTRGGGEGLVEGLGERSVSLCWLSCDRRGLKNLLNFIAFYLRSHAL